MKTRWLIIALSSSIVLEMQAQVAPNPTTNNLGLQTSLSTSNALRQSIAMKMAETPPLLDPVAVAMRAQQTNQSSPAAIQAVELASLVAAQQSLSQAKEIELVPGGAIARFGPHRVFFAADAKTLGAVDLQTPDGQRLMSTVFGMAYFSPDGKQSALIAELRSTGGELLSDSRVLYRNAFEGDVEADVLYTYTSHSLEQDVVIRKQIPPPEDYNLPPDSRLAVMTEFLSCPMPRRMSEVVDLADYNQRLGVVGEAAMPDETLVFGTMRITAGKAFVLGQAGLDVPVAKSWQRFEGRDSWFLIESTPYPLLKAQLDTLPHASILRTTRGQMADMRTAMRRRTNRAATAVSTNVIRLAKANSNATPGVVLDYLIVNNASLNVDFGWGTNKTGFAAIGQSTNDYWNWYVNPGLTSATLTNLHCNVYDFYVYAARASDYSPVTEFKRAGTSLWIKGTTSWGNGWYSTYWDEGQQYMRFRKIAVTDRKTT